MIAGPASHRPQRPVEPAGGRRRERGALRSEQGEEVPGIDDRYPSVLSDAQQVIISSDHALHAASGSAAEEMVVVRISADARRRFDGEKDRLTPQEIKESLPVRR